MTKFVLSVPTATDTPGALAGIWCRGQGSWTIAAGIGDVEAAPVRLDDHCHIASITKTFTATRSAAL